MKRMAALCLLLAACGQQTPTSTPPAVAAQVPDVAMVPLADASAEKTEIIRCLNRWRERVRLQEQGLRSERRLREATYGRIGDGSADDRDWIEMLRREEERAERNRVDAGNLFRTTDPSTTCFTD